MEPFVFMVGVIVVAAVIISRGRARTRRATEDRGLEGLTQGLPDDLRDKNMGQGSLPNRGRPWGRGN